MKRFVEKMHRHHGRGGIFCQPVSAKEVKVQLPQAEVESKFGEQDFVGPLFTETNTKIKVTEKGIKYPGADFRYVPAEIYPSHAVRESAERGSRRACGYQQLSRVLQIQRC